MVKYCCQLLLVLAVLSTSALTGCGQKGPLYLHGETVADQQQLQEIEQETQEEELGPEGLGKDSGSLIPSRSP